MAYDYISCLTASLILVTGLHVCSTEDSSTSSPELPDPLKDGTYPMGCEEEFSPERTDTPQFWPGAIVPYVRSDNFRDIDHQSLDAALADYHKYTCIRFIPRTNEESYLNVEIWSNLTGGICGSAAGCYQGGPQRARIQESCSGKTIFIHELGHSLCLRHEHQRFDRDEYLDLSTCEDPSKISSKVDSIVTTGHVYDYFSHMHYPCYSCVGKPKLGVVVGCSAGSKALGVIDADKLNFFYNCQGCFRHRWYRVDSLTSEQETHLVNFASQEGDNGPLYMCRGYLDTGSIPPGIYIPAEKACVVNDDGMTHKTTRDIQLFGIPGGPTSVQNATTGGKGYMLFDEKEAFDSTTLKKVIRAGRDSVRQIFVPAVTWLTREDGKTYTTIGYTISGGYANFPTEPGKPNLQIITDRGGPYFGILCCVEE